MKLLRPIAGGDARPPLRRELAVWADALKPVLTELLGPPAKEDRAPPSTGDPKAARK